MTLTSSNELPRRLSQKMCDTERRQAACRMHGFGAMRLYGRDLAFRLQSHGKVPHSACLSPSTNSRRSCPKTNRVHPSNFPSYK